MIFHFKRILLKYWIKLKVDSKLSTIQQALLNFELEVKMNIRKRFKICLLIVLMLNSFQLIYANEIEKSYKKFLGWAYADRKEFSALPECCKAKYYGKTSSLHQKWQKIIGKDYGHFHHYCRGLTFLRRGRLELDKIKRERTLRTSIKEMTYTITHSSSHLNPKIRAMIHSQIAQAFELMGKFEEALVEKKKAEMLIKGKNK